MGVLGSLLLDDPAVTTDSDRRLGDFNEDLIGSPDFLRINLASGGRKADAMAAGPGKGADLDADFDSARALT